MPAASVCLRGKGRAAPSPRNGNRPGRGSLAALGAPAPPRQIPAAPSLPAVRHEGRPAGCAPSSHFETETKVHGGISIITTRVICRIGLQASDRRCFTARLPWRTRGIPCRPLLAPIGNCSMYVLEMPKPPETRLLFLRNPLVWAVVLCFVAGGGFSLLTLWLGKAGAISKVLATTRGLDVTTLPHDQAARAALIAHAEAVRLSRISAFLFFRGYAALNLVVCMAVIGLSVLAIHSYLALRRTRLTMLAVMVAVACLSAVLDFYVGSGIQKVAGQIACRKLPPPDSFWDFCVEGFRAPQRTFERHDFTAWADALCSAATGAVVLAMFVVASSRAGGGARSSQHRCEAGVTLLLIAASVLLVSVFLSDQGYLRWAFAEQLMAEHPPRAVSAFIAAETTFNGTIQSALLGSAWFFSVILLERSSGVSRSPFPAELAKSSNLSIYSISAIVAPVSSAIIANLFSK